MCGYEITQKKQNCSYHRNTGAITWLNVLAYLKGGNAAVSWSLSAIKTPRDEYYEGKSWLIQMLRETEGTFADGQSHLNTFKCLGT